MMSTRLYTPLLDQSEPQPDMVVLKNRDDFYAERLPNADDILLVIEVAESSLEYDRETKLIGRIRG